MYLDGVLALRLLDFIRPFVSGAASCFDPAGELLGCTQPDSIDRQRQIFHLCIESPAPEMAAAACGMTFRRCRADGELLCYLLLPDERGAARLPICAEALAESLLRRRERSALAERDSGERIAFISRLTTGPDSSGESLSAAADQLKYNPARNRCALLFEIRRAAGGGPGFSDEQLKYRVQRTLDGVSGRSEEDIFGFLGLEQFVIFKEVDHTEFEQNEKPLREFAQRALDALGEHCKLTLNVGIGSSYGELARLRSSFAEAQFVIAHFDYLSKEQVAFVNHYVFEYLTSLLPQSYLAEKFSAFSAAVRAQPGLRETLTALSQNDNNLARTARELGIHRNTMLYRFTRLKKNLKIDPLYDDRDRLQMCQFALYTARKTVLRVGIIIQESSTLHAGCRQFADLIDRMSGGDMALSIHTVALSGDNRSLLETLRSGSLDFALCDADALAPYTGEQITLLAMPFLFDSTEEAFSILDGEIGEGLLAPLVHAGLIGLGFWSMGWRHISTREKLLHSPADLAGLKIRIMHKQIVEAYFRHHGAIPIKTNYSDIAVALKQGLIDSQENPYVNFLGMQFYETQSRIHEIHFILDQVVLLTTRLTRAKLSDRQWEIVCAAAGEASRWERQRMKEMNHQSRALLQERYGVQIVLPTDDERRVWKQSAEAIARSFAHQELLSKIKEAKKQFYEQHTYRGVV